MQHNVHNHQVPDRITPTLVRPPDLRAGFAAEVNDLTGSGLVHAGEQWAPARFMIEEHTHPVWEWYLQMHGMTRWFADHHVWTIRPGDLFGVAPSTRHAMAETPGVNHHFYYAAFDPSPALGRQVDLADAWPVRAKAVHLTNASGLIDPFAQLIKELTVRQDYLDVGLRLVVDRLLLELTRRLQQGPTTRAFGIHPAVHEVKTIIDREYARGTSLKELADIVGLAPNYLAGLFSAQMARSPHQYQTEQRLARAQQLLTTSDLSITAIAAEVGFSSGQHLARVFRQLTSTTPRVYRLGQTSRGPDELPHTPQLLGS